jgi:hypothetical protein
MVDTIVENASRRTLFKPDVAAILLRVTWGFPGTAWQQALRSPPPDRFVKHSLPFHDLLKSIRSAPAVKKSTILFSARTHFATGSITVSKTQLAHSITVDDAQTLVLRRN